MQGGGAGGSGLPGACAPHLFGIYRVKMSKFYKISFFILVVPPIKFASTHPAEVVKDQHINVMIILRVYLWKFSFYFLVVSHQNKFAGGYKAKLGLIFVQKTCFLFTFTINQSTS